LRTVVTFPGLYLERFMRRERTLRTFLILNFVKKEMHIGAGTCLYDINDQQAPRCAEGASLLFPNLNPGWE